MPDRFLFLDVETTDLNPRTSELLEVGFVVTDTELTEIDNFDIVIKPNTWEHMVRANYQAWMPPVVIEMHTNSGLLKDVAASTVGLVSAEAQLLEWLRTCGMENEPVVGSTVRFDRNFIEVHMPLLGQYFHYRSIDVSTLKELARHWAPDLVVESTDKAHRAVPDCRASITELKTYRENGVLGLALK